MAAYAALLSLAQTTDLNRNQCQYPFSFDAAQKVRSIHEYVMFLLSFLEDFPDKADRWEGKIRKVAHEAEDIIELFMWHRIKIKGVLSFILEEQLTNVTEEIGLIVGDTMDERAHADLPVAVSESSRFSPTGKDAVIGLRDDLMEMKDRLCGLSSKLQVIPIVGMGGIGKTTPTLARTVYNDSLIMEHFQIRVWLTVSQDYSEPRFKRTLFDILDSMKLLRERMSGQKIDDSEMEIEVHKTLKGRRYLILTDDVWSTKFWDDVRNMFPDDNNGSRIMFTTRLSDLATYSHSVSPCHEMKFMNDQESWDLLEQKVFTNRDCPTHLEDVGKEIARRCAGLPLAVVLVAGILSAVNETRASWEEIAKNVNLLADGELDKILSLSYTHLPHYLRPCFLFIGGFPEDASIRASNLIKLWVAEGFSKHQNECSKSMEDEVEEYLEDLVNRNLVIVNSRRMCDGKIKRCSLHDIVRVLCIRKAHEDKFIHVVTEHALPQSIINQRRISDLSGMNHIFGPTIRTILCLQFQKLPWLACLGRFRLLKVLDVVCNNPYELPSQLFELFNLRYLAFKLLIIPSTISNLVNLETLIIYPRRRYLGEYSNAYHLSLPREIWRMPRLRHLVFYNLYTLPHSPEGSNMSLENLQTLSHVENLVWNEKILQRIPNVKRLGLVYQMNQEYHLYNLKFLHQLEKLEVGGYEDFSWQGQNPNFPRTLKKLTLVGGGFPWKDMNIIGSLPNLQVLKLLHHACDGETWETADEGFPQLKFLLVDESCLQQWITQSSHFPRLKCLILRSCSYLREIPEGIGEISTLQLIEVDYYCTKSLMESAKQIEQDQHSYGNYGLQVMVNYVEPPEMKEGPQLIRQLQFFSRFVTINPLNLRNSRCNFSNVIRASPMGDAMKVLGDVEVL